MRNPKRPIERVEFPRATRQEIAAQRAETACEKARLEAVTGAAPLIYPEHMPRIEPPAGAPEGPEGPRMVPRLDTYTPERLAQVWDELDKLKRYDRATYDRSFAYHMKPIPVEDRKP